MKYVWIQYYPGDCGTFFAWFVNQHKGFVQNRLPFKVNDPVKNEVTCDAMMWEWQVHEFEQDFLKYRVADDSTESFDVFNTRISFKTYPEHNLHLQRMPDPKDFEDRDDWEDECMDLEDQEQERRDHLAAISHDLATVQLYTTHTHRQRFVQRMAACFDTFGEGESAETFYQHRDTDYANTAQLSEEVLPNSTHVQIDIGAMLFDHSDSEYARLCTALELEPNPNWKTLFEFYRVQVFENY